MDDHSQREDATCVSPFWPAGLPPVRPQPFYQTKTHNRFQPFTDDGEEVLIDEGEQRTAEQQTEQPIWKDDVEPIEYEDEDDNEPEEFKRQKSCEAPSNLQRQEHIESNHATYRGWCDVCIKARATGTPRRLTKQDEHARKYAERDGPIIYSAYFYMSTNENSMPHLAFKLSRSGRMAATALPAKGAIELGVKLFARQNQSTGVRSFINHSDGENAINDLKEAAL